ncbi:hypothetical protein Tco_0332041 [Tanacetum coccineum]
MQLSLVASSCPLVYTLVRTFCNKWEMKPHQLTILVFRGFFVEAKKLDWTTLLFGIDNLGLYYNLRISSYCWVKGSKRLLDSCSMTMDPETQQNLDKPLCLNDMLKELKTLFAQQTEQELLQTTRDFHSCKQENGIQLARHWKRNCPQYLAELLKKKKNAASGAGGGSGNFVIELNTFLNRSWIYDTGCGTHICNTTQGLRASRKLKPGALSLYVGNGQREVVEAIWQL